MNCPRASSLRAARTLAAPLGALAVLCGCSQEPMPPQHSAQPSVAMPVPVPPPVHDAGQPPPVTPPPDAGAPAGAPTLTVRIAVQAEQPDAGSELCPGDCVLLTAEVEGGSAPYSFDWGDPETAGAGPHRFCPEAAREYAVEVADTPPEDPEFMRAPLRGSARVEVALADDESCTSEPGEPCSERAEPGSFDPTVLWSWNLGSSYVSPLVADLTDDNGDGAIDLQDTPDVVLVATVLGLEGNPYSVLVVLDGATGAEHFRVQGVLESAAPALGDIDGNGVVDIVLAMRGGVGLPDVPVGENVLAALRNDGTRLWTAPFGVRTNTLFGPAAIGLADLDNDGAPEILAGLEVHEADGALAFPLGSATTEQLTYNSPTAVDLDADGDLEVVLGGTAFRNDGSVFYENEEVNATAISFPDSQFNAVADLDADGAPEIVVTTTAAIFVLAADGTTLHSTRVLGTNSWAFPPAIHKLAAGAPPAILVSDGMAFRAFAPDLTVLWEMPIVDGSGIAAGTAFDFLGDGTAEAMYADEQQLWVFDGLDGHSVFGVTRSSFTIIEYPAVADIDNDGSADVLVVSSSGDQSSPGLQAISDRDRRWVPARRILNQDGYHVTNVNDDGTIPQHEVPHWTLNNSFRAQAQVEPDGTVCVPEVD